MTRAMSARRAALEALAAVFDRAQSLPEAAAAASELSARDTAFAKRLAFGVLRWFLPLDWLAGQLLSRPLKQQDQDIHRLLLLGLYQLWQDDTPPHAAVHATTNCARELGKPWATGLVNAVLRRFQRERDSWLERLAEREERFAHPRWLLECLRTDWPGHWQDVVEANNLQAPLWLRVNRSRAHTAAMQSALEEAGFRTHGFDWAPEAIAVTPPAPVNELPGFAAGLISVQDAAAQLAAPLLEPRPGDRILDACAAPGGKACHVLELEPEVELTCLDRVAARTRLIEENFQRLGLHAQVQVADAARPETWWDGKPFGKILLDAPCSATGVVRRHPEIKWLRQPEQVDQSVQAQAWLLDGLWPLVGAGGMLVYATCSVLKRENSRQVEAFLERHADARCTGPERFPGRRQPCGRQILPGEDGLDGFYYAVLRKAA